MLEGLEKKEERFRELERLLADVAIIQDQAKYRTLAQEHSLLRPLIEACRKLKKTRQEIHEAELLLSGKHEKDLQGLAREEITHLKKEEERLEGEIKSLSSPKSGEEERNVILEIRAGTGGEEASLFAADLYRMYSRFINKKGWRQEILSSRPSATGGFKEIIFSVKGKGVYNDLRGESGTHRVQRVPRTESQGRIHTSTVTVAVLPEVEEVELKINPPDLRIDVFRSGGHGGQSVNTTDSAVRITHLPSGLVVTCQDERSQLKNRAKAMRVLRARLYSRLVKAKEEKLSEARREQVGTGDRSEKIRTYNFPGHRVTDHRAGKTLYELDSILEGNLDKLKNANQN